MKKSICLFLLFVLTNPVFFAQDSPLRITRISDQVYVYTTYKIISGSRFPSNSMYVLTTAGVVLIDTPWDESQFQPLLDSLEKKHGSKAVLCISSHFHDDRTAGLDYFQKKGIATYSSKMTFDLCALKGEKQAANYFVNDTVFTVGGTRFETFYPGEGHSPDNIVIWLEQEKILFGGCLVKSIENKNLGNTADANLPAWTESIKKVQQKFPKVKTLVPGHFRWSGKKALKHTLKLLGK